VIVALPAWTACFRELVSGLIDVPVIGLPVSTGYGRGGAGEARAGDDAAVLLDRAHGGEHRQRRRRRVGGGAHRFTRRSLAGGGDEARHDRQQRPHPRARHRTPGQPPHARSRLLPELQTPGRTPGCRKDPDKSATESRAAAAVEQHPQRSRPLFRFAQSSDGRSASDAIVGTPGGGSSSACAVTMTARIPTARGPHSPRGPGRRRTACARDPSRSPRRRTGRPRAPVCDARSRWKRRSPRPAAR